MKDFFQKTTKKVSAAVKVSACVLTLVGTSSYSSAQTLNDCIEACETQGAKNIRTTYVKYCNMEMSQQLTDKHKHEHLPLMHCRNLANPHFLLATCVAQCNAVAHSVTEWVNQHREN